jgi:hypothetical protein
VYLQNGVEYALVVLSDSNNYKLWISQTDTVDVETNVRISSQPYNGVLFKSQNASTWTADQTQDMKFVIRRAEFSSSPVNIEFIPPKLTFKDLGWNPLNFVVGSRRCRVEHKNHGMIAGEYVVLKTRQIIDSINGIDKQYIFDTPLRILSAELDSYVVEFGGAVNRMQLDVSVDLSSVHLRTLNFLQRCLKFLKSFQRERQFRTLLRSSAMLTKFLSIK